MDDLLVDLLWLRLFLVLDASLSLGELAALDKDLLRFSEKVFDAFLCLGANGLFGDIDWLRSCESDLRLR